MHAYKHRVALVLVCLVYFVVYTLIEIWRGKEPLLPDMITSYKVKYFDSILLQKMRSDGDTTTLPQLKMNGTFHIITTFFVFSDPRWSANLWNSDTGRVPSKVDLQTRQDEVLYCLKANLQHKAIASINILHNSSSTVDFLSSL